MPRVFHVSLQRTFDCTIVADTKEELEEALGSLSSYDFDEWDLPEWTWTIRDPLENLNVKNLDSIPDSPSKSPTMGVLGGEILNFSDVLARKPDIREELTEEVKAVKRRVTVDELNLSLPLGDE